MPVRAIWSPACLFSQRRTKLSCSAKLNNSLPFTQAGKLAAYLTFTQGRLVLLFLNNSSHMEVAQASPNVIYSDVWLHFIKWACHASLILYWMNQMFLSFFSWRWFSSDSFMTSVLPWHADSAQSQRQRQVLRPVGHDGSQVRPVTDCVGSPAATADDMASHRECRVLTLEHPA